MMRAAGPDDFEFPARIDLYQRDDDTLSDYERRTPGMGRSCGYFIEDITTRTMTAYRYDRQLQGIVGGLTDPLLAQEFRRAVMESFGNPDFYCDVEFTDDGVAGLDACPSFRFAAVTFYDLDVDAPRASLMALTAWRGAFVKLRITRPPGDDAVREMLRSVEAWSEYLWSLGD